MGIIKFSTVDEMGIDQMGVDQVGSYLMLYTILKYRKETMFQFIQFVFMKLHI